MDKWIVDDLVFVKDTVGYYVPEAKLIVSGILDLSPRFDSVGGLALAQKEDNGYFIMAVCRYDDDASAELFRQKAAAENACKVWVMPRRSDIGGLYLVDDN